MRFIITSHDVGYRIETGVHEWVPSANKLVSLSDQYKSAVRVDKALRLGSYAMIGYDAYDTYNTIQEACTAGIDMNCKQVKYKETGGFAGRATGSYIAVYITTVTLAAAPMTAGTSLVVGVIACAVAGYVGSQVGDMVGKGLGTKIFETKYNTEGYL